MVGVSDPRRGVPLLLEWFAREGRDLPWRRTYRPYEVLLSEILLQQTRMEAAVPYFLRFLERFPTLEALAGGDGEENARILREILGGAPGPKRDVVVLNAAAALQVAGHASSLAEGAAQARRVLDYCSV